jgi:hypothetical protein
MLLLPLAPSLKRWPGSHVVSSLLETGETGEMNWMKHMGERELVDPMTNGSSSSAETTGETERGNRDERETP